MSTTILEYSKTEAALTILKEKFSIVPDVSTTEGYKKCKSDAKEVGEYRISLEKKRKEIKGPALERCKEIDAEAKRIAAELAKIEDPLKYAFKKVDEEKKRVQEALEKAIEDRIEGMAVFIDMARNGANSEEIAEWIEQVSDIDCADGFGKFTKEALLQKNKTLDSLQIFMEAAISREIEVKKLADGKLELAKEKKEAAEKEADKLLIQVENDHEFGLMLNDKFDSEKEITKVETVLSVVEIAQEATEPETVRGFLTRYNESKGYDVDDESLIESLTEANNVYTDPYIDMHRWYGVQELVNEIGGAFIAFSDYIITGDNSMSDMDLHYNLDEMSIVQRKERTVVEVYYE